MNLPSMCSSLHYTYRVEKHKYVTEFCNKRHVYKFVRGLLVKYIAYLFLLITFPVITLIPVCHDYHNDDH